MTITGGGPLVDRIAQFFAGFVVGCIKLLTVLSPAWLFALWLLSLNSGCRGDCAVGMAMLIGLGLAFAGPYILAIGVPLALGITYLWTHGRPAQMIGAFSLIPILFVIFVARQKVHEYRQAQEAVVVQAELRPEYLSRTIERPVGRIDHLILAGTGGPCSKECYDVLINDIAERFSYADIDDLHDKNQNKFEGNYSVSDISYCLGNDYLTTSSIDHLQSHGIFDSCLVIAPRAGSDSGTLIGGHEHDRTRPLRPHGLQMTRVAQIITDGVPGAELARWEYGSLPGDPERVGEVFSTMDFIRAFTGVKTDRFAALKKLTHGERLDLILATDKPAHLRLLPVLGFIGTAPDVWAFGSAVKKDLQQDMPAEDIVKLTSISKSICATTPTLKRAGEPPKQCVRAYNDYVLQRYPRQADVLMLAAPPE